MTRWKHGAAALVVAFAMVATTRAARAQSADNLTRLKETLKREPRAPDVVKMALDYYRVSPEQMESARSSAHSRAFMPVISAFVGYQNFATASATSQTISNPQNVIVNEAKNTYYVNPGIAWDFRELIFNPSELQTYAVVPMQKDIMLEVVRTYYLRRQLQIRLALKPPADPLAYASLDLRVEEYTGILDAMTGGGFSRVMNAPRQQ